MRSSSRAFTSIEGGLDDLSPYQFATHIDMDLPALVCELSRNVSHPDILFQIGRRTSRSNFAEALAIDHHVLSVARDSWFGNFKAHQPLPHAFCFLFCQRFAADEIAFVQFADPAEVRFQQSSCFIDLMAVKRHACLEPKGVACCEATGKDACI